MGHPISVVRTGISSDTSSNFNGLGASNGDRFLVAWTSKLRGGQAMLFDAAGRPLSDTAFSLPLIPAFVFWNGQAFAVIGWREWVQVSADGTLLDAQPRKFQVPVDGAYERMVWSGSSLFIVLRGGSPNFVVSVCVFDVGMKLTTSHAFHVAGTVYSPAHIAADGDSVLLLLHEGMGPWPQPVMGTLFSDDGQLLRKNVVIADTTLDVRALGSPGDGSGYLVLTVPWSSYYGAGASFPALHVDSGLRTRGLGIVRGSGALFLLGNALTWDGSAYTFFYGGGADVRALRLSSKGSFVDDRLIVKAPLMAVRDVQGIAGRGTTVMLYSRSILKDPVTVPVDFYLHARVGHDLAGLAAAEDYGLERSAFLQETPVAATSATQSLVTWRERLAATAPLSVFATRLAADGSVVDPGSLLVAGATCDGSQQAVATDGRDFLVAWYDRDGVAASRIGADGSVASLARVNVFRSSCLRNAPLVVWNGTHYLVIWTVPAGHQTELEAARLRADGTLLDTIPLNLGRITGNVVAASNGDDYLLAWNNTFMRVSGGGTKIDHSGMPFPGTGLSAIWWNGSTYSVVHSDSDLGQSVISRISPGGAVTPNVARYDFPMTSHLWLKGGSAACDAKGCSTIAGKVENGRYELFETRMEDDGVTAFIARRGGASVSPLFPNADSEFPPPLSGAAVRQPRGSMLAAYLRRVPEVPFAGATRIYLHPTAAPRARVVRH